jgi:hypothetical protein
MLVAAQAVENNANLLFGRILLPLRPADVADGSVLGFRWWRRYAGYWMRSSKPRQGFEIKPPPTIDPIQQLLDEIDERSGS